MIAILLYIFGVQENCSVLNKTRVLDGGLSVILSVKFQEWYGLAKSRRMSVVQNLKNLTFQGRLQNHEMFSIRERDRGRT